MFEKTKINEKEAKVGPIFFLKKNKIKDAEISDNFFGLTVVNLVGK